MKSVADCTSSRSDVETTSNMSIRRVRRRGGAWGQERRGRPPGSSPTPRISRRSSTRGVQDITDTSSSSAVERRLLR
eukprot:694054-Heterocapsa_arctica.AAC.1